MNYLSILKTDYPKYVIFYGGTGQSKVVRPITEYFGSKVIAVFDDTENLKLAITAFQSGLKIITRKVDPLKWSEMKSSLGQALQIWGDMVASKELLELAVKCCREALQMRSRNEAPLNWAMSQNNLGSALFLLGRRIQDIRILEDSIESFNGALSIYQAYGANRLKKVTERNLEKTKSLLKKLRLRSVAKMAWENEPLNVNMDGQKKDSATLPQILE